MVFVGFALVWLPRSASRVVEEFLGTVEREIPLPAGGESQMT
jgi:hypothetical protein